MCNGLGTRRECILQNHVYLSSLLEKVLRPGICVFGVGKIDRR